jgi:hypothetical protein
MAAPARFTSYNSDFVPLRTSSDYGTIFGAPIASRPAMRHHFHGPSLGSAHGATDRKAIQPWAVGCEWFEKASRD